MVDGFYRLVVQELQRLGYKRKRGSKGSHEKWQGPPGKPLVTVPYNLVSRHTANGILRDAGSTRQL
jgi:predicted RNA binding protein YcfA (HicA-like mRNA interferase family)